MTITPLKLALFVLIVILVIYGVNELHGMIEHYQSMVDERSR